MCVDNNSTLYCGSNNAHNVTKDYLSFYYGLDKTLPDDEFYCLVKEINRECEEKAKMFNCSNEQKIKEEKI